MSAKEEDPRAEAKQIAFETLLDSGKVRVLFLLDVEGVVVPDVAKAKSPNGRALALDYSRKFAMPSFKVDGTGIRAVLTFGGKSFMTFVPWSAVVGVVQDGKLMEAWAPDRAASRGSARAAPEGLQGGEDPSEDTQFIQFTVEADEAKWVITTVAEG